MDLKALGEYRMKTFCKKGDRESHVIIQSLSNMSISIFWKISMENKIEMITINRNLVNNFFLLVIEEVF